MKCIDCGKEHKKGKRCSYCSTRHSIKIYQSTHKDYRNGRGCVTGLKSFSLCPVCNYPIKRVHGGNRGSRRKSVQCPYCRYVDYEKNFETIQMTRTEWNKLVLE